jgi:hypothetical protein
MTGPGRPALTGLCDLARAGGCMAHTANWNIASHLLCASYSSCDRAGDDGLEHDALLEQA